MTDTITLASRLAGAVWGHLVGDAVGVPYEFHQADEIGEVVFGATGTHHQPPGTWSDDGALMLALLDSLLDPLTDTDAGRRPAFDLDDQGRRALAWQRDAAYTPDGDGLFDIGGATSAALRRLAVGTPAVDAGPSDEGACGNGSLMRILPVALTGRDLSPAQLIGRAHLASRVTHGHPRCQVACAVYCVAVVGLLRGQAPDAALAWAFAENERLYHEEHDLEAHLAGLEELRAWPDRGGRGFVLDSFWSAWDAFAGAADYADSIRRAVAYGHDTDTTAAIAGGLAGARWGWETIPLAWRRGMRGRDIVTPLVDGLVATTGARTSTLRPIRIGRLNLAGIPALERSSGRAGITFLPGKKHDGHSGPHWRDLDLDLARLRALGVDALFLLVEDAELDRFLVPELPEVMSADGPDLVRFPVRDGHTPADPLAYRTAVVDLVERIRGGQFVAIACRGGLDRSGMTAACVYRELGLGFEEAVRRTQAARKGSITQRDQQDVVRAWQSRAGRAGPASTHGDGHGGGRPVDEREIAPGRVLAVVEGDITRVAADAIVNAANNAFRHGGGVDGAIRRAAGPELSGEMRRRYPAGTPTGTAVATGAYALPARWVIHAVGPVWGFGGQDKLDLLASAYRSALLAADELGAGTICSPAISAGTFGFPLEAAADVALRTVRDHLLGETGIERVTFVLRPSAVQTFRRRLAAI